MPALNSQLIAMAMLATAMAAIVVPTVIETPASDQSLALRNALAVRAPAWDGTTGLLERGRNTVALFATTTAALGSVVVGTCSSPFSYVAGPWPCVIAVTGAIINVLIGIFVTTVSANSNNKRHPMSDAIVWHYSAPEGGSIHDRIVYAHDVEFNDGLPVLVAHTTCSEQVNTCHKLWYSKMEYVRESDGQNRTRHRVHATPHDYDFRAAPDTTQSALKPRQTQETDENVKTDDGSTTLYGGYVWEEGIEAVLSDIANEGTSQNDTVNDVAQDVIGEMSSESKANGKYNDEGVYCQDWASSADTTVGDVGTEGYLWYYMDMSKYPASEEDALLKTCAEQDGNSPN